MPRQFLIGKIGDPRTERRHFGEQQPVGDRSPLLFADILDVGHDDERFAQIGLGGLRRDHHKIGARDRFQDGRFTAPARSMRM